MSITTTTALQFTHRFAGPCRSRDLQPYARPDILSVQATNDADGTIESIPHLVIRFGHSGNGQVCLEIKSDCDEEIYGIWTGSNADLAARIKQETRELRLWNLVIRMSRRMMLVLLG